MEAESYDNYSDEPNVADSLSMPHSVEAEQSVLGGLMLDNSRFDAVAEYVNSDDFYQDSHRQIFSVMQALSEEGKPFNRFARKEVQT